MIYKIVAVIGVIFLLIFGLVLYSALTTPAKTLVQVTPIGEQQAVIIQPVTFAQIPALGSVAHFHFGIQESIPIHDNHALTGLSLNLDRSFSQALSGPLTYTQLLSPYLVSTTPVVTISPACNPSVISAEV